MNSTSKLVSDIFKKLSDYEELRGRTYPSRYFLKCSNRIKWMKDYKYDDDRIIVITNYENFEMGPSSSQIFDEILKTGVSSRLIDYERTYGVLGQNKTDDKRISYESAKMLVDHIYKLVDEEKIKHNLTFDVYVAGSFRRKLSTIGDLDLIVTNFDENKREEIVNIFNSFYEKGLVAGLKKVSGLIKGVQVDVRFIENKHLPCMLLHCTGSAKHNIYLRKRAISLGYHLNEYCITDASGNEIYPLTESEIFNILKLDYVDPTDR